MVFNVNGPPVGPDDYLYDVFLSYSYKTLVKKWVVNKFSAVFTELLDAQLIMLGVPEPKPPRGRVCIAKRELKPGDDWPNELQEQLRRSRVLVAICSPHYVSSGWCMSEWKSFRVRGDGLIVPVLYDGNEDFFAPHLGQIQFSDFSAFMFSTGVTFKQKVKELAESVATRVIQAPPFGGGPGPVVRPPNTPDVPFHSL